jgi:hypothetical protein
MYRRLDGTRIVDTLERLRQRIAALHVQDSRDPVVLDAVNDVETLTTGLPSKIWQKIMIIDTLEPSRRLT